jgi:predicted amidophosphoribosyltransferase
MLFLCPTCGYKLAQVVTLGGSTCANCNCWFETTPRTTLLSFAWFVRRSHISSEAALIKKGCNPSQAIFLIKFVYEIGYTHQELSKLLEELNVSNEI